MERDFGVKLTNGESSDSVFLAIVGSNEYPGIVVRDALKEIGPFLGQRASNHVLNTVFFNLTNQFDVNQLTLFFGEDSSAEYFWLNCTDQIIAFKDNDDIGVTMSFESFIALEESVLEDIFKPVEIIKATDYSRTFLVTNEMVAMFADYIKDTPSTDYHIDIFKEQWWLCFNKDMQYFPDEDYVCDFSDVTYEKLAEFQHWCRYESGNQHIRSFDDILFYVMALSSGETNRTIFCNYLQFEEALDFCKATCEDLLDTFKSVTNHH